MFKWSFRQTQVGSFFFFRCSEVRERGSISANTPIKLYRIHCFWLGETFWIGKDKMFHLHSVLGLKLKIVVEKIGITVVPNLL